MSFYIYKYMQDKNIVYIGKTKNLDQRIKEHKQETKFKNQEFSIYYFLCKNEIEMNAYEYFLINKYLPALNVSCKNFNPIEITEPGWILWTKNQKIKNEEEEEKQVFNDYNKEDLISVSEYAKIKNVTTAAVYKRLKTTLKKYLIEIDNRKFLLRTALEDETFQQIKYQEENYQQEYEVIKSRLIWLEAETERQKRFIQQLHSLTEKYLDHTL